jgi:hypothetical protein
MSNNKLTRRIAAAVVAACLTVGGLAAVVVAGSDHAPTEQEQAGATWSRFGQGGGATTQGGTWS